MSSCRVFGAGRFGDGCVPSRNAGGSGGPSKNAPAPAGGVPSKERRDIPSQGSLRSAQVRAACPHRAPAAFARARGVLLAGGCRVTRRPVSPPFARPRWVNQI